MKDEIDIEEHDMKGEIDIEEHDVKDEIDIEEHDVLDNPRIRTIFPDLAQIKKEIAGDYQGPDSRMEYQAYSKSKDSRQYDQEDTPEYARFRNEIILGSKPSSTLRISEDIQKGESVLVFGRKSVEIKQEAEEYEEVHHPENVHEEKYNSVSTVLILGSTPSSSGVIEPSKDIKEGYIDTNDPKNPTAALVLLENWGPRLENNSCYCKECLILFPTTNTLLAHNVTAHSFLVAVDKNKAVKSTAKPNVKEVSNDSGKFYNHCNDSDSLSNHLFEKLTFDKNNSVSKPQLKKVVPNPSSETILPKQLDDDAEFGSEMKVYDQEAVALFQCQVCSIYLEYYGYFFRHMTNYHSKTEFSEEKVLFNGTCLLCNSKAKNKSNYNRHIKRFHPEVYNHKGPLPHAQVLKKLVARTKSIPKLVRQTQSQKFQCQKCNAIFIYYGQARRHRETKHPEWSQNIFKKITTFNNKSDLSSIKPVHHKVNLAVYNNTLYKCKLCRGHFLTKRALKSHVFRNKPIKRYRSALVNCPDCNFTFKQFSLLKHSYVHHETMKLQREDFKIKYIDDFNESDNESDVEKSDNKSDVENTSQDSADNSQCSVETSGNFSEGDNARSAVDTTSYKTDNTDDLATFHVKNKQCKIFSYSSILYKCGTCNTIFQSSDSLEVHLKEHPSDNQDLVPCFCGLIFSRDSLLKHTVLHHDKQNLSMEDLYILTMGLCDKYAASKHLFRCETCQVCFCKLNTLENHLSTVEHSVHKSTCPHCGLMILTRSLPWHVKVHHGIMKLKREDFVVLKSFGKNKLRLLEPLAKKETNPLENLIQNKAILHKCCSCGTHYINASVLDLHQAICQQDTIDTVVCEQCQLKFSKNGLETHVETHHKNMQLKIDDFQIINYGDDDNIIKHDNEELIINIAKDDDIKELTVKDTEGNSNKAFTSAMSTENEDSFIDEDDEPSKSKNKNANKLSELSKLYQCGKCKTCFITNISIKQHKKKCESIQPIKKCDQCQLTFLSNKTFNMHINRHHRSDNFKFHVILVNHDEKSAISRVVKGVSSKNPLDKDDYTSERKNNNANKLSKLYQCGKCKTCFITDNSIKRHYEECESIQPNNKCDHCQLMFPPKSFNMHINRHHRSDNFKFQVVLVNYDEKSAISRVFKTVSSKKPLDKDDDTSESKNKNANKLSKLYQCGKCKTCFITDNSIKRHYEECESIQPNYKCDHCQLMIPPKSFNMHINRHHRSDNFKFKVVLVNYDEKSAISRVVKTVSSKKPLDKDEYTSESKNLNK